MEIKKYCKKIHTYVKKKKKRNALKKLWSMNQTHTIQLGVR